MEEIAGRGTVIDYHLAETRIVVSATIVTTVDDYDQGNPTTDVTDVEWALHVGADRDASLTIDPDLLDDFGLHFTPDDRLARIFHETEGNGPAILKAGATVAGVVVGGLIAGPAGAVASVAAAGGAAAASKNGLFKSDTSEEPSDTEPKSPEDTAMAAWRAGPGKDYVDIIDQYALIVTDGVKQLADARRAVIDAMSPRLRSRALVEAAQIEVAVDQARTELARIDVIYRRWRQTTITVTEERRFVELRPNDDVGYRCHEPGAAPTTPGPMTGEAAELWETVGIGFDVELVESSDDIVPRRPTTRVVRNNLPDVDAVQIWWREPLAGRLRVWKRNDGGTARLTETRPVQILHPRSRHESLTLHKQFWGSNSADLRFDEDSRPTLLSRQGESGAAAALTALAEVPGAVAGGVSAVNDLRGAIAAGVDFDAERAKAALVREKERKAAELEASGLHATAAQHAELAELEQAIRLADARSKLAGSPPSETQRINAEIELLRARHTLELARRGVFDG